MAQFPSFQAIQHCIWSNLTWKGDGRGGPLLTVHPATGCVKVSHSLPKSRPIAKGFDAILWHCHLRCDFVFTCRGAQNILEMHARFVWCHLRFVNLGFMKNHKRQSANRLVFILYMTNTAKNSWILWQVKAQALTAAVQLKEFGSSASSSCMASSKSNAACVVALPRLQTQKMHWHRRLRS